MAQRFLAEYLESGAYERHVRGPLWAYETQVGQMMVAVERYFPRATHRTRPQGGYVRWFALPEEVDAVALHARAVEQGVAFVPGELFSPSGLYRTCLRLNCGHPMKPEIEAAVRRLDELPGGIRP